MSALKKSPPSIGKQISSSCAFFAYFLLSRFVARPSLTWKSGNPRTPVRSISTASRQALPLIVRSSDARTHDESRTEIRVGNATQRLKVLSACLSYCFFTEFSYSCPDSPPVLVDLPCESFHEISHANQRSVRINFIICSANVHYLVSELIFETVKLSNGTIVKFQESIFGWPGLCRLSDEIRFRTHFP
jgi:hypothetical protein